MKIDADQKNGGSLTGFITMRAGMIRIKLLFAGAREGFVDGGRVVLMLPHQ